MQANCTLPRRLSFLHESIARFGLAAAGAVTKWIGRRGADGGRVRAPNGGGQSNSWRFAKGNNDIICC